MSYNKDLQDSGEPLFDCVKTVNYCLTIMQGVIGSMVVKGD